MGGGMQDRDLKMRGYKAVEQLRSALGSLRFRNPRFLTTLDILGSIFLQLER